MVGEGQGEQGDDQAQPVGQLGGGGGGEDAGFAPEGLAAIKDMPYATREGVSE